MDGGTLESVILNQTVELDWKTRVKMSKCVSSAIAFLHSKNIMHRDIKSENIMVDSEFNVKMCDFGFARAVENDQASRQRTMTMLGTPYYSAPEILLGKPYDFKADVFSFGVLVLEIITRRTVSMDR